jgi:hypothetical protein
MGAPDDTTEIGPDKAADNLRATVDLAKRDAPLQVGDFEIDDEGRLRPRTDGEPLVFGFSYRGADFIARILSGPEPHVSLSAELGKLPFSAQVGNRRRLARRIVEATERLPHGHIRLSEDQDMHLSAEAPAPAPLTPVRVMAALTALLLEFKPYLELLHEAVNAPPVSAADE